MLRLIRLRQRLAPIFRERLRYSRLAAELEARLRYIRFLLWRARGAPEPAGLRLLDLATALRRTQTGALRTALERQILPYVTGTRANAWRSERVGWQRQYPDLASPVLVKSLVLKAPGVGEKGVLYSSFEVNGLRLLAHYDVRALLERYILVVASSSSPPDYASFLAFANCSTDPIFVQISNPQDVERYAACAPTIQSVPIMACDWVNPHVFHPREHSQRGIDILMVAGWSRSKGHSLLFRALKRMGSGLRTVLIGQDMDDRTADHVWREAQLHGVASRIEIIRDAPPDLVTEYQCDSRASVVLSRREGSSVVTTESFFADAPVAMLKGAHVGASAYINPSTGILTTPKTLHLDLSRLVESSAEYSPRAWAMSRLTCFHATARLNAILRTYAEIQGLAWSCDIVQMHWRPDPVYVDPSALALLQPAYDELYEKHGMRFRDYRPSQGLPAAPI